jgi:FixJ family two-component response regulator
MTKIPMISIIDDDESVREATRGLVRSLGYKADTFASAEEFLHSERVTESSCVITDVHMPGLSGVELQRLLKAQGHPTPVIFLTAFAEESIRARVLRAGAIGFLTKPFREECLIDFLNSALNHRSGGHPEQ